MQKNSQPTETQTEQTLLGYARVSTEDQNLALQLDALIRADVDPRNIYRETVSGAKDGRPEFDRMMRELRPGVTIVVWKLDRLSRSLRTMLETVDRIEAAGAHLRLLTESIDTGTAAGRAFLQLLGVIAEFERNITLERTRAGLARARAEGRVGGRRRLYTQEQIREAFADYEAHRDYERAAKKVRNGTHRISVPNLKKRFRELRQEDRESEREQRPD